MGNFGFWRLLLLCLFIPEILAAQQLPEKGYFRSPLDMSHYITGTFAEPRPDHLHSGIDLGTGGTTGRPVYAMADGYVSRIKVSARGYGRALYLTHPNHYVTVYGHLEEFNVVVNDYIKRKQKEKQSWEIDFAPNPALFLFKKGDVIGYSGNTGSSTGPHLHLEIRSEESERPLNPALFGIYAVDARPPVIKKLMIYPKGTNSTVNGKTNPVIYSFEKNTRHNIYTLPDTVKVDGACCLSVVARDYVSSSSNDAGVYRLEMTLDSIPHFSYQLDSFAFDETRYVNDLIDYREYVKNRQRFLKLYCGPGNRLNIFKDSVDRGLIVFQEEKCIQVKIMTTDFVGNEAILQFIIFGKPLISPTPEEHTKDCIPFSFSKENKFETDDISVTIPYSALFEDICFNYTKRKNGMNHYSAMHMLHNKYEPLFLPLQISLRASAVPLKLVNKTVVARIEYGNKLISLGGKYENGWLSTTSNRFGDFIIAVDTIAPSLKPLNFTNGKTISGLSSLRMRITDELSGIAEFRIETGGKWILTEYDAKKDMLIIQCKDELPQGKFVLRVQITDKCGNQTIRNYTLLN